MRLCALQINGFGGLRDRTISFGDGVTVLLGPNEAGKSTVLHCLTQVLFGKPTQRSAFPDFAPWDGGDFAATLELDHEGSIYRLTRQFAESGSRAAMLTRINEAGDVQLITRDTGEIRRWVSAWCGTSDDRIFYRVFCLTQADVTPLDHYGGLREQLERVASGAEVAVASAVQRVDARLAALRRGVGQPALEQNWGALKRAEEARKSWEARLHQANRQQKRLGEVRARLQTLESNLAVAGERIAEIASLFTHDRTRKELELHRESAAASWQGLEQERERRARLTAELDRLTTAQNTLPAIYTDTHSLRQRLREAPPPGNGLRVAGILLFCMALAFLAIFGTLHWPVWAGVGALVTTALALGVLLHSALRQRRYASIFTETGAVSRAEVERSLEKAEQLQHELVATKLALQAIGAEMNDAERRSALALQVAACDAKLAQLPGQPLTMEEAHGLQRESDALRASIPGWQDELRALERESAVLEEAERDLIDLEDAIAFWQGEEARAKEEESTLLLARELLLEAGQRTHRSFADPLTVHISPLFAEMTGGRYPEVRVTGDAKAFDVLPFDISGTPVPPESLSRGARDQFLLAVRLGLGLVIAGTGRVPVFLLDDPLVHFDAQRRSEALAMLTRLASRAQVILATHDVSICDDLPGAEVISLGHSAIPAERPVVPLVTP